LGFRRTFTIEFIRLDPTEQSPSAPVLLVSRVSLSPLMVAQSIEALGFA
jgi:hypothetical protein